MKKFLYIAYPYPPIHNIGAMRSWKLAKYICEFGWEPIVLASASSSKDWGYPLPDVRVERIENRAFFRETVKKVKNSLTGEAKPGSWYFPLVSKGQTGIRLLKRIVMETLAYPDIFGDWRKKAIIRGREIMSNEKIDLILSTAIPFSSHIVASTLSMETGIPWIADYRDLWTQSPSYRYTKLRFFFERRLEKSTLNSASAIVTVSEPLASELGNFLSKPVHTITNGYDPQDYSFTTEKDPVFSIAYTGFLYEGRRTPFLLFEALRLLLERKQIQQDKLEVHFYGSDKLYLKNLLNGQSIASLIHLHDAIPIEDCIRKQKSATVLLFLSWNDLREKGLYSGKIFEYLAAERPILAFPRNQGSVVDALIEKTQSGVLCDTPEEIAAILKKWYDTFYSNGELPYFGIGEEIERYSRKNQAQQFANLFDEVLSS